MNLNSKLGIFEGSFKSSTFVYTLKYVHTYIRTCMHVCIVFCMCLCVCKTKHLWCHGLMTWVSNSMFLHQNHLQDMYLHNPIICFINTWLIFFITACVQDTESTYSTTNTREMWLICTFFIVWLDLQKCAMYVSTIIRI